MATQSGQYFNFYIVSVEAAGDGIRALDNTFFSYVQNIETGGTGVNLGDDGRFQGTLNTVDVGGYGVFAGGTGSFLQAIGSGAGPTLFHSVNDSFHLGENANLLIGSDDPNALAYEVRATGPGASVVDAGSGLIFSRGANTHLIAEDGPAIRVGGTGSTAISLEGLTQGTVGIIAEDPIDQPAPDGLVVSLLGTLHGTSGVAADLNDGRNFFVVGSSEGNSTFIDGDVLLKGGDDYFGFYHRINTNQYHLQLFCWDFPWWGCAGRRAPGAGS